MFYSEDILLRKKGGLGVVWLAATLGPRNQTKRITKRDFCNVDLVEACDFVAAPPEPMALRLSSNLMVGITRVYSQQCNFYFHDVSNVFGKLKRNFEHVETSMPHPEAKPEVITMPEIASDGVFIDDVSMSETLIEFGWVRPNASSSSVSSSRHSHSPTPNLLIDTTSFQMGPFPLVPNQKSDGTLLNMPTDIASVASSQSSQPFGQRPYGFPAPPQTTSESETSFDMGMELDIPIPDGLFERLDRDAVATRNDDQLGAMQTSQPLNANDLEPFANEDGEMVVVETVLMEGEDGAKKVRRAVKRGLKKRKAAVDDEVMAITTKVTDDDIYEGYQRTACFVPFKKTKITSVEQLLETCLNAPLSAMNVPGRLFARFIPTIRLTATASSNDAASMEEPYDGNVVEFGPGDNDTSFETIGDGGADMFLDVDAARGTTPTSTFLPPWRIKTPSDREQARRASSRPSMGSLGSLGSGLPSKRLSGTDDDGVQFEFTPVKRLSMVGDDDGLDMNHFGEDVAESFPVAGVSNIDSQEVLSFLNYLKSVADEDHVINVNEMVNGLSKHGASDAFFQCLVLATTGRVKVNQAKPFADIFVMLA